MAESKMKSMKEAKSRVLMVLKAIDCVRVDQVPAINYNNVVSTAVAKQLNQERKAFISKEKDYLLKHPRTNPNKAVANSFDVLLKFIMNIDLKNIYKPVGACDIGFTRNKKNFEIVNIKDSKELKTVIDALSAEYALIENTAADLSNSIKYIFTVSNESITEHIPKGLPFHYAVAVVKRYEGSKKLDKPNIYFLTPDEELDKLQEKEDE